GPGVTLQIGETLEDTQDYLEIFRNWFLLLLLLFMLLSAGIGWLMARRSLQDVEEVTQTAAEISKGAYDKRVDINGRFDEIERLGSTFNKMLDRIHAQIKSSKEINDNIAHDLRSPLTRIRGIAEMTLTNERSLDEFKKMAASTIEDCDSLINMINTMLEITEVESGVTRSEKQELDLAALISEACELFRPIAEGKNIEIRFNPPEKLIFHGDRDKLQRTVSNILENAIKYTPDNGLVSLAVVEDDDKIEIVFEDTGIGIAKTDLGNIFKRFYRCESSRTEGGVGLGLSLAKAFTEAMNGTISVASKVNQGSRFAVSLPR
ncbi:MAG: HAMP domain-containing histidine kinase, partial [Planctomycetes bacterium]|nr:HAMP domain-containing histidine kinase [Planctomycetota bacterium]